MMMYRVFKLVRFIVKKEEGKVVENVGRAWGGAQEFRKVGERAPEVEKGA